MRQEPSLKDGNNHQKEREHREVGGASRLPSDHSGMTLSSEEQLSLRRNTDDGLPP